MELLAISGSLRQASTNTVLLKAASRLTSHGSQIRLYSDLNDLPHYNFDLEDNEPAPVKNLRKLVKECDGIIISSPEYAHGVPGSLKNALDWLVGCDAFVNKPVALFNASSRSTYAQASLIETIKTMAGKVISEACITISLLGKNIDEDGIVSSPQFAGQISSAITTFISSIKAIKQS